MGATNASFLAQASGNYYCSLTDNNGCSINSDTVNIIITELEEATLQSLSVQPNPSNGIILVKTNNNVQIERIELFNVAGKLVWNEKIQQSGQQFSLNLSLIIKGIYFLKAYSSKGTIQKKLLIE